MLTITLAGAAGSALSFIPDDHYLKTVGLPHDRDFSIKTEEREIN